MPSCGLPDAVELCITKFVNIPPAEYIGDMALYEQHLVYYFFFHICIGTGTIAYPTQVEVED